MEYRTLTAMDQNEHPHANAAACSARDGLFAEFFHSAYRQSVTAPIASIAQLTGFDTKPFAPECKETAHPIARELGEITGDILDIIVVSKVLGGALKRVNPALAEDPFQLAPTRNGLTGLTFGAFLRPDQNPAHKAPDAETRLFNAFVYTAAGALVPSFASRKF